MPDLGFRLPTGLQ